MVGVLMVAIAVYVCVGLPNMNPSRCGHRGALILALRRHIHLPDRR